MPAPVSQPCRHSIRSPRPRKSDTAPRTASTSPLRNRCRIELSGSAMSSRIACTGAIRALRRDGSQAAAMVTTIPTA